MQRPVVPEYFPHKWIQVLRERMRPAKEMMTGCGVEPVKPDGRLVATWR